MLPSRSEGFLRRHDYGGRDRFPASVSGVVIVACKLVAGAHWELGGRLGPTHVMDTRIVLCCIVLKQAKGHCIYHKSKIK